MSSGKTYILWCDVCGAKGLWPNEGFYLTGIREAAAKSGWTHATVRIPPKSYTGPLDYCRKCSESGAGEKHTVDIVVGQVA